MPPHARAAKGQRAPRKKQNPKHKPIAFGAVSGTRILEASAPLFGPRTFRRLRFSYNGTLTSTAGVVSTNVIAANGLFQPDITGGTTHQPMGFDQMQLSFEHNTVVRSTITVTFRNTGVTTPTVSVSVVPSPTPITIINQIIEFGNIESQVLMPKSIADSVKVIKVTADIAAVNGATKILDFNVLRGDVANNPAEITYFHLQCWDGAGGTSTVYYDYFVDYFAWFTEPRQMTESMRNGLIALLKAEYALSSPPVFLEQKTSPSWSPFK